MGSPLPGDGGETPPPTRWNAKDVRGQNAGWVRILRLTYCVMGLTEEMVIMVSVLVKPVWGYGERVGNRMRPHHSIRVWRRRWASAVSQTRIAAHWAEFSPFPGRSRREYLADPVTGMFVEVVAISPTVRTRARPTLNGSHPGRSPGRSEIAQRRSSSPDAIPPRGRAAPCGGGDCMPDGVVSALHRRGDTWSCRRPPC